MVIHTAWAHGTRDELIEEIGRGITPNRSGEKVEVRRRAIADLEGGAALVKVGPIRYVVQGEAAQAASEFIAVMDDQPWEVA